MSRRTTKLPLADRPFADRRLMARACFALLVANLRYWPTVAPHVSKQLSRWQRRAEAIPDPTLRALAMGKLDEERFNSEVAATLATLAPKARRRAVIEAIVALQVMYDYLDVLGEQPSTEPLQNGSNLFEALKDAVKLGGEGSEDGHEGDSGHDYYSHHPQSEDGGYLSELVTAVRSVFESLPAAGAVAQLASASATRCAEAQSQIHATGPLQIPQLAQWAKMHPGATALGWQEFLAGATASVLAMHALIVAAAEATTTPQEAAELDGLYLCIGAFTMLDSLIDYQADIDASRPGYLQYYDNDRELFARRLAALAKEVARRSRSLPDGPHHFMTLVGIVAYYGSAPNASGALAKPVFEDVEGALRPLITPTLAVMKSWRLAKRRRR